MNLHLKNKKRILLLRHKLTGYGGAELVFIKEAEYFSKFGFEVFGGVIELNREVFNKYLGNFREFFVSSGAGFWKEVFELRKFIKKVEPDIIMVHENSHMHLFFAKRFLKKKPVCITHMYGSFMWLVGSELSQSLFNRSRIKKVASDIITAYFQFNKGVFDGVPVSKRLRIEAHALLDFFAIRSFDKIITCSKSTARELSIMYKKKPLIISGGVDAIGPVSAESLRVKELMKKFNLPESKKIILTVNRLDERKRIDLLMEAFLEINKKRDDAVLVIAGKGPEESRLRQIALGNKNVIFAGFIPDEFLNGLYFASEVVVYSAWCNWGLVPLECLELNKKVVVAKDAFIQEAISELPGVFVSDANKEDLADKIIKALDAPQKETKSFIDKNFSWEVYFKSISRLFDN